SLTKTFIAVLVMRLRDESRLDLADPLGKHMDAGEAAGATIAQLLAHTAGLASETPGPWWERSPGELRPGLADILSPAPHPAGRLFHYSNPGYGLLGALVGHLRGHGWEEALRQEILDPLGMTRTTLAPEEPHARGFAVHPWADVMQFEPADSGGLMAPAGELWSTAEDLCRFAVFLLDGDDRVLPAATLAEMRAPASPPGDEAWAGGYGLGLQLFRQDGRMLYGHSGSTARWTTSTWARSSSPGSPTARMRPWPPARTPRAGGRSEAASCPRWDSGWVRWCRCGRLEWSSGRCCQGAGRRSIRAAV
ncbi:MAG: serine hydrolase domain-containing protein, partial [Streptosporangiaceae bacterium]